MFKQFVVGSALILSGFLSTPAHAADKFNVDAAHSSIGFSVKHLMVSQTNGVFNDYTSEIEFDANDTAAFKANASVQVNSIDTKVADRDKHLKSPDFFDVEKFPTIEFKSKKLNAQGENKYEIVGDLTIKGVTKEIIIPVTIDGPVQSPFGKTVIGINGSVKINRQDYGVSWNKTMDNGGFVVSDDVNIVISIEANKAE